jgi:hypothetical protein
MKNAHLAIAVLLGVLPLLDPRATAEGRVPPWQAFEIELQAQTEMANPYVDGLPDHGPAYVTVVFEGQGGAARGERYVVSGFWDGGRTWKARFAPPAPGEWSYRSVSDDPGLRGKTGSFDCVAWSEAEKQANPTRRGFVRVHRTGPRPGRHFEYADGTPFLWLGDTWWNWTKRDIRFETFRRLVDDRAAKGFNVGQLFFAGDGWSRSSSMLDETHSLPDLEHIRNVERMIAYANSKGITVWVHGWWSRRDLAERVGPEKIRRWWRYLVHRLGAYNVIWVLAGEYNMWDYGGLGLEFWNELGRMIDEEDFCDRIISAHPTPPGWQGGEQAPQWSTADAIHGQGWLDYNQSQTGHGKWRNELTPWIVQQAYGRNPAKPIVVTEPWYEFVEGNPPAADVRFGGWSAILSGAAGHSYGGGHVWRAHVPESPAQRGAWPLEEDFETDTLDYPGARSLSFMAKFLRGIDWWLLEPHPELVHENPSRYCAAVPGKEYVVYLRWGGVAKIDLRPSSADDEFQYRWIDLVDERERGPGAVPGGDVRAFRPPEDYPGVVHYKDWVLHVFKTNANEE